MTIMATIACHRPIQMYKKSSYQRVGSFFPYESATSSLPYQWLNNLQGNLFISLLITNHKHFRIYGDFFIIATGDVHIASI